MAVAGAGARVLLGGGELYVGYVDNGHVGFPRNRMIDTYENITLPQLRWWVVEM